MENCRDRILSALFRMVYLCQRQFLHVLYSIEAIEQECINLQKMLQQCKEYYERTNDLAYVSRAKNIRKKLKEYYMTFLLYTNEYTLLPDFIYKLASPLLRLLDSNMDEMELSPVGKNVSNQANHYTILVENEL